MCGEGKEEPSRGLHFGNQHLKQRYSPSQMNLTV